MPDLTLVQPLSPGVQLGAEVLFWSFIISSYFILLNLLIAIFNTTYERVQANSVAEWLFIVRVAVVAIMIVVVVVVVLVNVVDAEEGQEAEYGSQL